MSYYNHYNLDEIAEAMNAPQEVFQTQNLHFEVLFQDLSRTQIKVILDTSIEHSEMIQNHLESIYAVGRVKFRKPNEFILFLDYPTYDFFEFHNQILEALDEAFQS